MEEQRVEGPFQGQGGHHEGAKGDEEGEPVPLENGAEKEQAQGAGEPHRREEEPQQAEVALGGDGHLRVQHHRQEGGEHRSECAAKGGENSHLQVYKGLHGLL